MYQIRRQHRNEEARELIPSDYAGVMISDRGKGYDADEFEGVGQQKCWGHILRNIADVAETKLGRARDSRPENEFADKAGEIKELVSYHLRDRNLTDADNQRLLDGLGAHDDRGHLLRLREAPFVEPANNRAERILRPAVIARKVSQCSKNQPGPEAFAAFKSIAQTAVKNGAASVTSAFRALFTAPNAKPFGPCRAATNSLWMAVRSSRSATIRRSKICGPPSRRLRYTR